LRAGRFRAIASWQRIRPPIQKDVSPEMTIREEMVTFPSLDKEVAGTRRWEP